MDCRNGQMDPVRLLRRTGDQGGKSTLFHFYLPFSKVRVVKWIPDQSLSNVFMALDYCFRYIGGVPTYVPTDRQCKDSRCQSHSWSGCNQPQDGFIRKCLWLFLFIPVLFMTRHPKEVWKLP